MAGWNDPEDELVWFAGENPEALKTAFIDMLAKFPTHEPFRLAKYVFRGLHDIDFRAGQAAKKWLDDPDVFERAKQIQLKGPEVPDADENSLIRRALQIADNQGVAEKNRLEAIALVAKIKGYFKKEIDLSFTPKGEGGNSTMLRDIATMLPN